jgi:dihydrofolate synthase/folylpolyglutamate synthase
LSPLLEPARRTLAEWLAWIETLYPRRMELGLERVHAVLARLGLAHPPFAAITVTGTNGKGSTTALCEAMLRAGGYRVGCYTSPHLVRYNERIAVGGRPVSDETLVAAFEAVEHARGEIPLTYFEFGTLAAFEIFRQARVEIAVLEVGLGGRLDAVNGIDADAAILTTVDIDHTRWLGTTREAIGREKAGIFRAGRPAVIGDLDPPASVLAEAARRGARLYRFGRDFTAEPLEGGWTWRGPTGVRAGLPRPALYGPHQLANAACAIMALEALADRFPLGTDAIREGLLTVSLPGRFQVISGRPFTVLDVAHNPQAVRTLAECLRREPVRGRTLAVFGMLKDKDIAACAAVAGELVDVWYLTDLPSERSASAAELSEILRALGVAAGLRLETFSDPVAAFAAARQAAREEDRIVAFGSFYLVGAILASLEARAKGHGR